MIPSVWHGKDKTMRTGKRSIFARGWEEGRMNMGDHKIFRAVKILWVCRDRYISLHIFPNPTCTTAGVNPNVYYGLWAIKMWQSHFLLCNKCTILVEAVDNRGAYASVGTTDIGKIYTFLSFCCEHKTLLKNKIYLKMKKIGPAILEILYFPRTEENIWECSDQHLAC